MHGFDDILGQENIIKHFEDAISTGKISHAYILSGEEGSGKHLLASRAAAALLCTSEDDVRPCGSCASCFQAEAKTNPDIINVVHEKQLISVGDIRTQIVDDIQIKPDSGKYKIYIIDEAERMNEQAQNALLKTLEEPPSYVVIFLLATNTGSFLPTILSRCISLPLRPVKNETIAELLASRYNLPDYIARTCASFSGGSIGKAIRYATEKSFNDTRDAVIRLMSGIDSMNHAELMDSLSFFDSEKGARGSDSAKVDDFLDLLSLWMRDMLLFKATQDPNKLIYQDSVIEIKRQASLRSFENINEAIDAIEKARKRLKASVYFDIAMEMLLMALRAV
ncbi:MAG: DNA polymerase III subunit delta' [Lachnospiraceae bacterium]|nr:DNA polymerase III subunit delta' [Lachnospiraceae bacterium]